MTAQHDLDRALVAWLEDVAAPPPPPELLPRAVATTSRLRPRPAFVAAIGSHWIGESPYESGIDTPALRRLLVPALMALLAIALIGAAVIVGSRLLATRPAPPRDRVIDELVSAGGLSIPMAWPLLTQLADGRVLAMGSGSGAELQTASAEVYVPATGASVPVGPMVPTQWVASATRLMDNRVLVLGGDGVAQIFDPATMRFEPVGAMVTARRPTVSTRLRDGRVLVIGEDRSAELFDPDTLTFSETGSVAGGPINPAAVTTLPDGRIFIPVGVAIIPDTEWAIEADLYDAATGTFVAAGRTPDFDLLSAFAMPDGRVIVVGSVGMTGQNQGRAAVWDPATRAFSQIADPPGRVSKAALLDDGRILLLGFVQSPRDTATCPGGPRAPCTWGGIYDPGSGITSLIAPPAAWQPSLLKLSDGRVLVVGGLLSGEVGPAPAGDLAPAVRTVQIYQ